MHRVPIVTSAVALLVIASALPAQAGFPGKDGKLTYESRGAVVVSDTNPGTDDAVTVVDASRDPEAPRWSPDGTRIVMYLDDDGDNENEIWVVNADGSDERQLTDTHNDYNPSFSPDGTLVVFERSAGVEGSVIRLMVTNADGTGNTRPLTDPDEGEFDFSPVWSPDGRHIAFESAHPDSTIAVMDPDGSHRRTFDGAADVRGAPSWSPDSTRIAYQVSTSDGMSFVIKPLSGGPRLPFTFPAGIDVRTPDWSPDGVWIIYSRFDGVDGDIYKRRADGTGPEVQLADSDGIETDDARQASPSWQPLCNVKGNSSANTLHGTSHADLICGGLGNDVITGRGGNDIIFGSGGRDRLTGDQGHDVLVGGDADDTLRGLAGSDRLLGQKGNDGLDGGAGPDVCFQGPGSGALVSC